MREILFRGKRIDNGEWVEGNLIRSRNDAIGSQEFPLQMPVLVAPTTVGQYTGLTDKHGKKIFDGDVIRWKDWNGEHHERPVKYDQEWNRFCVWTTGASSLGVNKHLSEEIEVIGNVHDTEATPC